MWRGAGRGAQRPEWAGGTDTGGRGPVRGAWAGLGATIPPAMTAKEKLLERVTKLSEAEADETLRLLELRADPVVVAFRDAPEDDEPWTAEDEAAVREAEEDPSPSIPLEEIKAEFGIK